MPNLLQIDEARRVSFDARAELYDAARPSYPDALVDDVLSRGGRRVLEIGAGTGKATVVFARRGASIVAIEPGASLAAVLRRNVAGLDVTVENTTFEAWPIARPFDVVMAAQAIHWIDLRVRYAKPAAVLAPGGTLAVIRNEMMSDGLGTEIDAAYARWHPESNKRPIDVVETARRELVDQIDASGLYGAVDFRVYPWTTTYTTAQYLDLLDTYSDHALLAEDHRAPLYQAIAEAIERRGGVVEISYVSLAFLARRA
jgi:trans-aconitate methyltransferase